ncbi:MULTISPECIES: 2-succinyl-6-hydroxy-2,4-cyclohexadiene-1-carboxylate synthase [unclassified Clostridium]|uniref:2-succinyl-6-hydroxy-2, 4-cyclohexadiene-1-carboxylate synthase n=1 Tax=unclassified Clostridium TaxID=2614128 RepID=UPI0002975B26|nr:MULTISPECIES: 2-succinyl-6-hydroxy-2,4-cyclohexadiene-1-carboxylate synthase [unclassified Clostridium]EKQ52291.1 MAG: 2-succinyl-6-hydroxy-2,4-cyclohexadiene-1-carboxylate synthase [Clostridium sp. Maddingley MBC34-26]
MFIEIENIKYHIEVKGEGKPIICLHGFSEDISTWNLLELHGYKLILIDLIGHGKSDKPKDSKYYSLEIMLKHLNTLIAQLNLKKYSMLGYSMGGRCVLAYALTYPNEIDKLILESVSYGEEKFLNRLKRRGDDLKLAQNIEENGIEWFNQYWGNLSIFESQKSLPKHVINEINKRRLANSSHALSNTLKGTGQGKFPCLKDQIVKLSMPTLFISGEYDKKYQEIGKEFEKLNSKVKHIVINGCGHNTHIENINRYVEILNEFL